MTPDVHTSIHDQILVVTLDRPKANAIDAATSRALHDAIVRLRTDDALRAAVVTGAGERFFSAGWDLTAAADGEAHDADHGPGGFAGITELFGVGKPIIASVNGSAYGGGVELMLAADLAVASEDAVFAFPEARLGILPDAGGTLRLPARLPRALAVELLLTGRTFTAAEALGWGLINRMVPAAEVGAVALDLAESVCAAAPLAVAAILDIVEQADGTESAEAFDLVAGLPSARAVAASEDAHEGARAFSEKRPPRWIGR